MAKLTPKQQSQRDNTLLMLQWVIWKHLSPRLSLDGERMQQLATGLAHEFYGEGVRMPLNDDPEETTLELTLEIAAATKELPPVPLSEATLRHRQRWMAHRLYREGWRKFSDVA